MPKCLIRFEILMHQWKNIACQLSNLCIRVLDAKRFGMVKGRHAELRVLYLPSLSKYPHMTARLRQLLLRKSYTLPSRGRGVSTKVRTRSWIPGPAHWLDWFLVISQTDEMWVEIREEIMFAVESAHFCIFPLSHCSHFSSFFPWFLICTQIWA